MYDHDEDGVAEMAGPHGTILSTIVHGTEPNVSVTLAATDEDFAAIAAAPTDVATLLAECDRLRAENERLEALFQQTHGVHHGWVARAQEADKLRAELEAVRAERDRLLAWRRDAVKGTEALVKMLGAAEAYRRNPVPEE
jgi:hypothetical protein